MIAIRITEDRKRLAKGVPKCLSRNKIYEIHLNELTSLN
jgi:hypothetical protein